jgi:RND superfamily putative drug exporter
MISQALYRLGHTAARRPWTVIGSWLVLTVVTVLASGTFGHRFQDTMQVPGLDSQQAAELMTAAGADDGGLTAQVVVTPRDRDATFFDSAPARSALAALQADAAALPHVLRVTDPAGALAAGSDVAVDRGMVSADGRVALLRLQYPALDELSAADLDNLKGLARQAAHGVPLRIEMGGDLFFAFEQSQPAAGELIGLLLAAVILFVAFGSLAAAALPLGTALVGLAAGVSSMSLMANVFDVPSWAPVLGAMVGLGVGIDYALFIVTRHRDNLAAGLPVAEAAGSALATAGKPVVVAGGIVVVAILGLVVAGVPFMTAGGVAVSVVVLVMVAVSVTLLPALLGVAGRRIARRGRRLPGGLETAGGTGWSRWIGHVTRNPWPYAVGVTVLLLALALPVLALRPGIPDDGSLPQGRTERQAYDLVARGFGPGSNGPVVVAIDMAGDNGAVDRVAHAVGADPGIASVAEPEVHAAADVAVLVAVPTTGPQDAATHDTVERLRAEVLPRALAGSAAQAHVGGQTANFADVGARVNERLPVLIGAVLAMSFVLLMLAFRSVLVPLKAVVFNLLSIGAAYGVLVMVFQWGWAAGLIGVESTVPIVSFIPMFMFAILFGLSMDYEVFLLSRVREEYVATGDNRTSIVRGVASTGRVITSAALIMICVFLSFVLGHDAGTKMFGLGLATAILVDATLVRMVLVPATMTLLGDANWWLPRRFQRPTSGRGGTEEDLASDQLVVLHS